MIKLAISHCHFNLYGIFVSVVFIPVLIDDRQTQESTNKNLFATIAFGPFLVYVQKNII